MVKMGKSRRSSTRSTSSGHNISSIHDTEKSAPPTSGGGFVPAVVAGTVVGSTISRNNHHTEEPDNSHNKVYKNVLDDGKCYTELFQFINCEESGDTCTKYNDVLRKCLETHRFDYPAYLTGKSS